MTNRIATGTRFFGKDREKDLPRIDKFIEGARQSGISDAWIFIAINVNEDKTDALSYLKEKYPSVDAFAVTPWGKFVAPLNAIVTKAGMLGADYLLLASAEFPPLASATSKLEKHMDAQTLMAGARLPDHEFKEGIEVATGMNIPWNTYNLLNMSLLMRTGFVLIGDAPFDVSKAGVEELSTAAVQKHLYNTTIKLVHIPQFYKEWNMEGWDEARIALHNKKIDSKKSRPEAQMVFAKLKTISVYHVIG